jgi:hypothetical protein
MSKQKKKEPLYSLILQAVDYAPDDHWKKLFENLAKGVPPKRIMIDTNNVKFFSKKDGFTYNYTSKTPEEIASDLRILIGKALCLYSEKDLKNQQESKSDEGKEFKSACSQDDWKKVKNKKMKDLLITNFVIKKKTELNLNWKMARSLYQTINNALYEFHTHKSADIDMEDGEISDIADIEINEQHRTVLNTRIFQLKEDGSLMIRGDLEDDTVPVKKKDLSNEWGKFLTYVSKRYEIDSDPEVQPDTPAESVQTLLESEDESEAEESDQE